MISAQDAGQGLAVAVAGAQSPVQAPRVTVALQSTPGSPSTTQFSSFAAPLLASVQTAHRRFLSSLVGSSTLADCRFKLVSSNDPSASASASSHGGAAAAFGSPPSVRGSRNAQLPKSAGPDGVAHDEVIIPAHRVLLSQYTFFASLFSGDFADSTDPEIVLDADAVDKNLLLSALEFIYTGWTNITHSNAYPLYALAEQLTITALQDVTLAFMNCCCSVSDLLSLLSHRVSSRGEMSGESSQLVRTCLENLGQRPRSLFQCPEFLQLPPLAMRSLLMGDTLGKVREEEILEAVSSWARVLLDREGRTACESALAEVAPYIRWAWIPKSKLFMIGREWTEHPFVVPGFREIHHKALMLVMQRDQLQLPFDMSLLALSGNSPEYLFPRKRPRLQKKGFSASPTSPNGDLHGSSPIPSNQFFLPAGMPAATSVLQQSRVPSPPILTQQLRFRLPSRSTCVAVDGDRIYTGHVDREIHVWDLRTGDLIRTLAFHSELIVCLDARDGLLVSGARDNHVMLWDASVGTGNSISPLPNAPPSFLLRLEGHEQSVYGVVLAPWLGCIYSCSRDRTVRKWNYWLTLPNGATVHSKAQTGTGSESRIVGARSSPAGSVDIPSSALSVTLGDNSMLYVACGDGNIRIVDGRTMVSIAVLGVNHTTTMRCVHFCGPMIVTEPAEWEPVPSAANPRAGVSDGIPPTVTSVRRVRRRLLVAGATDGTVFFYDCERHQLLWRSRRHTSKVFALAHSTTHNVIVSSSEDMHACVWNPDLSDVGGPSGLRDRAEVDIDEDPLLQIDDTPPMYAGFPSTAGIPGMPVAASAAHPPGSLLEVLPPLPIVPVPISASVIIQNNLANDAANNNVAPVPPNNGANNADAAVIVPSLDGHLDTLRVHQDWVTGVAALDRVIVTCSRDESVVAFRFTEQR
eukprot:ANDGO_08604.mRNA.1 F-box/WD repeat-containing protein pof11